MPFSMTSGSELYHSIIEEKMYKKLPVPFLMNEIIEHSWQTLLAEHAVHLISGIRQWLPHRHRHRFQDHMPLQIPICGDWRNEEQLVLQIYNIWKIYKLNKLKFIRMGFYSQTLTTSIKIMFTHILENCINTVNLIILV